MTWRLSSALIKMCGHDVQHKSIFNLKIKSSHPGHFGALRANPPSFSPGKTPRKNFRGNQGVNGKREFTGRGEVTSRRGVKLNLLVPIMASLYVAMGCSRSTAPGYYC